MLSLSHWSKVLVCLIVLVSHWLSSKRGLVAALSKIATQYFYFTSYSHNVSGTYQFIHPIIHLSFHLIYNFFAACS